VVELLLDKGADIHAQGGTFSSTSLVYAAGNGNAGVVEALLHKGADIDATQQPTRDGPRVGCSEGPRGCGGGAASPTGRRCARNRYGRTAEDLAKKEKVKRLLRVSGLG
jgi:ankyrin repeat protein